MKLKNKFFSIEETNIYVAICYILATIGLFFLVYHTIVSFVVKNGLITDTTVSVLSTSIFFFIFCVDKYKNISIFKEYGYIISGLFITFSIIYADLATLFLSIGVLILSSSITKAWFRNLMVFLISLELYTILLFLSEGYTGQLDSLFKSPILDICFVIVVIIYFIKDIPIFIRINKTIVSRLSQAIGVLCVLAFLVVEFMTLTVDYMYKPEKYIGYLYYQYSGKSVLNLFRESGSSGKVFLAVIIVAIISAVLYILKSKLKRLVIEIIGALGIFISSFICASYYISLLSLVLLVFIIYSKKYEENFISKIKSLYFIDFKKSLAPLIVIFSIVLGIYSLFIESSLNKRVPEPIDKSITAIDNSSGWIAGGLDFIDTNTLEANISDPTAILLNLEIIGMRPKYLNIVVSDEDTIGTDISVYGLDGCVVKSATLEPGNNSFKLDNLQPEDWGLQIGVVSHLDQVIRFDKILLDDYGVLANEISEKLRMFFVIGLALSIILFIVDILPDRMKVKLNSFFEEPAESEIKGDV